MKQPKLWLRLVADYGGSGDWGETTNKVNSDIIIETQTKID